VLSNIRPIKLLSVLLMYALLMISINAACTQTTPGATVIDNQGREVQLEGIPARIVSHVPSITEMLFALDLGDSVVGVSDYCNYPEEAKEKPSVGGYYTPSIEKITSLDPDLVLTDGYAEDILQLDGIGIPYIVLDPPDIDGVLDNIQLIGEITGVQEKASELVNEIEGRIDAVVSAVADAAHPRVFYVFDASDPTKPWTAGPGSFVDAFIRMAGGENIAAGAQGPWVQFSMEELIDADPEIIIVDAMMGTAANDPEEIKALAGWKETTAAKENQIYTIDGDLVNRHGPRIAQALEEMARIIHPELFNQ
jgi:iron complex transport system substrate-binding protein